MKHRITRKSANKRAKRSKSVSGRIRVAEAQTLPTSQSPEASRFGPNGRIGLSHPEGRIRL